MSESVEILTPVGRLVGGHPMNQRGVVDDRTKQPVIGNDGKPVTEVYIGFAIPKAGEQHWNQTPWGAEIHRAAALGWPNGEHGSPTFAWKIDDGDSAVPNRAGIKPCDREGYPGHWVLKCSTRLDVRCYHAGKYDAAQQIQNPREIKPGDYCRLVIHAKANAPSQSPGVYLNPSLFELTRPGQEIVLTGGPSAEETFGASAPGALPPGAQVAAPAMPPAVAPAPPAPPAPDFLTPGGGVQKVMTAKAGGASYEQFVANGWTDAQLIEQGYLNP